MTPKEIHKTLADQGIRIFMVRLRGGSTTVIGRDEMYFIHPDKTVEQWREDLRGCLAIVYTDEIDDEDEDRTGGWASDKPHNHIYKYMHELGYVELADVVADVYEGRLTNEKSRIVDDPDHEEQADGFGHFGWESKNRLEIKREPEDER